jgi:hypothetical protein
MHTQTRTETVNIAFHVVTIALVGVFMLGTVLQVAAQIV